jgi:putative methyltransferase (TIGR04325 family)
MFNLLYILRLLLNYNLVNFFLKISNKIYIDGNYQSWDEALKISKNNYSSKKVLEKIKFSFIESLKLENFYERDGMILKKKKIDDNIIIFYKKIYYKNKIKCNILDVGGGTGSIYFKNQQFLEKIENLSWTTYDQPKLISFVKKKANNSQINYIPEILPNFKNKFDIVLAQSSLQYFSKPYDLLNKLCNLDAEYIIIDETPLINQKYDKICIQHNPKKIYLSNYPLYILSKEKINTFLKNNNYKNVIDKKCFTGIGGYNYQCMIFKKIN